MERPSVTAVTHSTDEARVTLTGVRDEPGVAGRILRALAEANINVDMIIQNEPVSHGDGADLSFTIESDDLPGALEALDGLEVSEGVQKDDRTGKVSVVGAGMRSHPGVAAKVFETLGKEGINIEMISTSPIKISCVIAADRVPDAVKALHAAFELAENAIRREEPTGTEHRPTVGPDGDKPDDEGDKLDAA
jgi:aspartate kinase